MKLRRIAALLVTVVAAAPQVVHADDARGVGAGMEPVAEIPYDNGTHLAATRIDGRISTMTGVGIGDQGTGPSEIAWYLPDNTDAFSAKFDRSGRFVYVNDLNRGFAVYELRAES